MVLIPMKGETMAKKVKMSVNASTRVCAKVYGDAVPFISTVNADIVKDIVKSTAKFFGDTDYLKIQQATKLFSVEPIVFDDAVIIKSAVIGYVPANENKEKLSALEQSYKFGFITEDYYNEQKSLLNMSNEMEYYQFELTTYTDDYGELVHQQKEALEAIAAMSSKK